MDMRSSVTNKLISLKFTRMAFFQQLEANLATFVFYEIACKLTALAQLSFPLRICLHQTPLILSLDQLPLLSPLQ
jgi:hypothetical protein